MRIYKLRIDFKRLTCRVTTVVRIEMTSFAWVYCTIIVVFLPCQVKINFLFLIRKYHVFSQVSRHLTLMFYL